MKISGVKTFIEEARKKDEKTKKKYLYVASSIATIIVIALWIFYLNITVPAVQDETATSTRDNATSTLNYIPTTNENANQNSFFKIFGDGLDKVTSGAASGISGLWNNVTNWSVNAWNAVQGTFQKTNTFNVQNTQTETATTSSPSPIPPTALP